MFVCHDQELTLLRIPQDFHPDARLKVDLVTLHRDRAAKKGIAVFEELSANPDRIVQPEFLDDLPAGAEGVWQILDVLCDEGDKEFANAVLTGLKSLSPAAITTLVISKMSRRPDFQHLYRSHCQKPIVALLVARMIKEGSFKVPLSEDGQEWDPLHLWDFNSRSINSNPFIFLLQQDLLTYVSSTYIFRI